MAQRFFLDTFFVCALLNRRDAHHREAKRFLPSLRSAAEVIMTEAIVVEVGDSFSKGDRHAAADFIRSCYRSANMKVVPLDRALVLRGVSMYERYIDKTWGLTDCISFVVMREHGLQHAATADRDFKQAGFITLFQ
jgi:predicted nucleic acid-binding protein